MYIFVWQRNKPTYQPTCPMFVNNKHSKSDFWTDFKVIKVNTIWLDKSRVKVILTGHLAKQVWSCPVTSCHCNPCFIYCIFKVSYSWPDFLRIPANDTMRNLNNFSFINLTKMLPAKCKICERNIKFFTSLPTMVGQQSKFCFLEHIKCQFHQSENIPISKK